MYYPELLRIRTGLAWVAGALGVLLLIGVAMRFNTACRTCGWMQTSHVPPILAVIGYSASLSAAIFASIYGASLASQNEDHLPIVLTKPVGRISQSLRILLMDLAGIVIVFGLTYAAGYLIASLLWGHMLPIATDSASLWKTARFLAFPLAWFGMTQGLSAGVTSNAYGWLVGPLWPFNMGMFALTLLPFPDAFQRVLHAINVVNPVNYFPYWEFDEQIWPTYHFGYGITVDAIALGVIALVGLIVAVTRWRYVEA